MERVELTREIQEQLAAPFPPEVIRWTVLEYDQARTRAKVVPYIPDWAVMDRLDQVVGPAEWSFDFDVLADGTTRGKLTICGVTKCSRGCTNKDAGGDLSYGWKARADTAVSLTGAAVLFGIGRDLRRLGSRWVDCDPQTGQFTPPPEGGSEAAESQARQEAPEGLRPRRGHGAGRGPNSEETEQKHAQTPKARYWKLASEAVKAGVSTVRIQQIAADGDWEAAVQALEKEMEEASKPQSQEGGKKREAPREKGKRGHAAGGRRRAAVQGRLDGGYGEDDEEIPF